MKLIRSLAALLILGSLPELVAQSPTAPAPGMLGVALAEVEQSNVEPLSLPGVYGAWVQAIGPGTPAEKAGIESDDVIVGYNGQRVESAMALRRMVHETPAGRTVEIRLVRDGAPLILQPVLGKGRAAPATAASRPRRSLGVWIEAVDPAVADFVGLDEGVGMIVRQVQPDSAADRAGLIEKDILVSVNGTDVTSENVVATQINQTPGFEVPLTVIRGGERLELALEY